MSSVYKKQEDKNLKILRELLTFESNRYCFDCDQRGPTYVNITIGSFVCTNCGGALRKYSHRVKSISMSNFNQTEMDFMKRRGNNICKKIYYGLCDGNIPPEMDIKNGGLDSHLRAKYELKKWYVEPTAKMEEDTINQNQVLFDRVEKGVPKPIKSGSINSTPNMIIDPPKLSSGIFTSTKSSRKSLDIIENIPTGNTSSQHKSSIDFTSSIDPSKLGGGSAVKLPMPDDNKNTNWPSSTAVKINQNAQSPFGDDFIFSSPKETSNFTSVPKSQTMNFNMPPLLPMQQATSTHNVPISHTQYGQQHGSDKYAALAELDDLFSTTHIAKQPQQPVFAPAWDSLSQSNNYSWQGPSPNTAMLNNIATHNPFSTNTHPPAYTHVPTFNPFISSSDTAPANWPGATIPVTHHTPANPFMNATPVNSRNPFL